jgi:hypothetical protein
VIKKDGEKKTVEHEFEVLIGLLQRVLRFLISAEHQLYMKTLHLQISVAISFNFVHLSVTVTVSKLGLEKEKGLINFSRHMTATVRKIKDCAEYFSSFRRRNRCKAHLLGSFGLCFRKIRKRKRSLAHFYGVINVCYNFNLYLRPSESRGVKKPKLNRKFFVGSAVK